MRTKETYGVDDIKSLIILNNKASNLVWASCSMR